MPERTIYLDHAATTSLDPRVLEVMIPYFTTEYGNASSIYTLGRHAMQAIDRSREQVAELLHARPTEIAFVGCGSESDNGCPFSSVHDCEPHERREIQYAKYQRAVLCC